MVNATSQPLYPWEIDSVPTVQEAGWNPGSVRAVAENLAPTGIQSSDTGLCYWLTVQGSSSDSGTGCFYCKISIHDKSVPVTTTRRVLRLRLEEWPPVWRAAANKLNKQLRTADTGCPPAWGLGEMLTTAHSKNVSSREMFTKASDLDLYSGMDWIKLAQERDRWRALVNETMNLQVPQNAWNFLTSCKPVSFSRRTLFHGVSKHCRNLHTGNRGPTQPLIQCVPAVLSR